MTQSLRLLLVEDSESDAALIVRQLEKAGYSVQADRVQDAPALHAALTATDYDVVISDHQLPQLDAPAAVAIVREHDDDVPILVVSGTIGEERAVATMKAGAQDYLMKDNLVRLAPAVAREIREAADRRALRRTEAERKRLEEQFRQAQKMESIGRVTGAVAHDFNNLLTVISGYVQMGKNELTTEDSLYEILSEIGEAARRAADLAARLLAFSRPQPSAPRDFVLNDSVKQFEKMLARLLGERIRLQVVIDGRGGTMHADPGQIEQILMNLAVNARDAMPEGGQLRIETTALPETRQVRLMVSDTGIGMTPEVQAQIFEPFFTTKEEGKGTGLGLATVYGIVKQIRGSIDVTSEPGRGTAFHLLFPASGFGEGKVSPAQ